MTNRPPLVSAPASGGLQTCAARPPFVSWAAKKLAAGLVGTALTSALAATAPNFVSDVRPIFAKHCVECHGPEKQKSGYRLDVKAIALTGGEGSAPNIVPGQGATSPLVKYIKREVEDMKMPPKGDPLSPAEIATITAWIDAGAVWPDSASAAVADPLDWCR